MKHMDPFITRVLTLRKTKVKAGQSNITMKMLTTEIYFAL